MLVHLPIRLESIANLREHWRHRAHRASVQREEAYFGCLVVQADRPELPLVITITRLSSSARGLDSDNLAVSAKAVRDGIADYLGVDDGDARIEWRYEQRKADDWGCDVTIKEAT